VATKEMKINRETSDKRNLCYYDEAIVQRRLKRSKRQLKQKHGQLTDDDLTFAERKDDELLGCLQKKRGKSTEDLRKEIEQPVNSGFDINDPIFSAKFWIKSKSVSQSSRRFLFSGCKPFAS
jgi:uncharacterized protein YjbJ (UPF0337 family)